MTRKKQTSFDIEFLIKSWLQPGNVIIVVKVSEGGCAATSLIPNMNQIPALSNARVR